MTAACSLGHVLLAPQRVPRMAADDGEQALLDDLFATIARVAADVAQGGTIAEDVEAACEALLLRLLERAGVGVHRAVEHLEDLVRPLVSKTEALVEWLDRDDPADVADMVLDLLGSLGETASKLSIERVREHVTIVLDVIEQDLGLTPSALDDELWALADDLIERLETPREGLDPAATANRVAVADTLRGVRRRGRGTFAFPALSADRIALMLSKELDALIGPFLEKAACLGHVTADVVDIVKAVKDAVPYTGFDSRTLGAGGLPPVADREYLWYASWLLGDDVWIKHGDADVPVRLVNRYLELRDAKPGLLPCSDDASSWVGLMLPTDDADQFAFDNPGGFIPTLWDRTYTFHDFSPRSMERLAYHSAWIAESLETLFHIWYPIDGFTSKSLKIKKGGAPSATDLVDALYGGFHVGVKHARKAPLAFWMSPGIAGRLSSLGPNGLIHGLGSLQGMHWNASPLDLFKMWGVVLVPSDAINFLTPNLLLGALRDLVLSIATAANYFDKPADFVEMQVVPDNLRHNGGVIGVVQAIMNAVLTRVIFQPEFYGHPTTGNTERVRNWSETIWLEFELFLCTLWGVLSWFLGNCVFCALIRRFKAPPGSGWDIALTIAKSIGLFYVNLFGAQENQTQGGTLNLEGGGPPFPGYQEPDDSPYLLPWAAGDTYICGQGNMGLFSHNFTNPGGPQVYAYDFMLDMGTEILAARRGVVVDYFDWVPDGTKDMVPPLVDDPAPADTVPKQTRRDSWNFIAIRHLDMDAQDLGPGTVDDPLVTTYAIYGHGLFESVRTVFGARTPAVGATNIIGTVVEQGEPIMLADSTGVSLCNHVHMEVRLGPAATVAPPIPRDDFEITIPFVFRDGGQPSTVEWLVSANERVPAS